MTAAQRKQAMEGLSDAVNLRLAPEVYAYREEEGRLHLEFQRDAEAFHGFQDLPRVVRDKIHSFAWEQGHSGGYEDVWNCYYEPSELAILVYTEGQKP